MPARLPVNGAHGIFRAFGGTYQRARLTVVVLAAAVLALVWGILAFQLSEHRDFQLAQSASRLANLTDVVDEAMSRSIAQIDQAVLFVRDQYLEHGAEVDLVRLRRSVFNDDPQFVLISVIGADGFIAATSGPPSAERVFLGDREHFTVHRDRTVSGLFVSRPVIGRVSGRATLQFTRRIDDENGAFLGVVVVSIDPLALGRFYRVLESRERMDVSLVGLDGIERLRIARDGSTSFGTDLRGSVLARAIVNLEGGALTQEQADGSRLYTRFHRIDQAPLAIAVGQSDAETLAEFNAITRDYVLGGAAAGLLVLLFVSGLLRQTRQIADSEAALRASEGRFRDGIESMGDGFVLYDAQDRLVAWNSRYENFFQYLRGKLRPGMSFGEVVELTARQAWPDRSDAEHAAWAAERMSRHHRPGASFEQVLASGRAIHTTEHRTAEGGIVSIYRDVTDLKDSERQIVEARERSARSEAILRDAIENTSEAFVLYDADDRLVLCNEKYLDYYPYLRKFPLLQGMTFEEIIRAGLGTAYADALALSAPEAWVAERLRRHRDPSGTIEQRLADGRWLMITERRTSSGGIVGFRTDITDLKRREGELEEARRKADQANLAKSEFLANMSHEIRTPLNGVVTMIDLIRQSNLSTEQRLHAETARSAADQLLHVIGNILDMTKLEAGAIELEDVPFDLAPTVERCVQTFAAKARLKGIALTCTVEPAAAGWYLGDPTRLRQILLNLIGNAVKFTAKGSVNVHVEAAHDPADAGHVRLIFEIADTGIGIPPEAQRTLFEKFAQADASIGRRFGGSGLGLAIVREIVGRMGGKIEVASAPGVGSRFTVALTLPTTTAGAEADAAGDFGGERAGLRVLLAEDDDTSRYAAARMLDLLGCDVVAVSDGAKAVAAAKAERFDVVLLDMRMPELDGPSAATAIRAGDGPNWTTPIVAVTANAFTDDIETCRAAGMTDHVAKPITLDILRSVLSRVRAGIAGGAPVRSGPPAPAPAAVADGPLDAAALARNFADLPADDVRRLAGMFLDHQPQRFADLRRHAAAGAAAELRRTAHTIKGLSMQFGARRLAAIAETIERAPPDTGEATTLERVAAAEAEYALAAAALKRWLASLDPDRENAVA